MRQRDPADFEQRADFGNAEANLGFLRRTSRLTPGVPILEIGSGRGALLRQLIELGCDARGVEIDRSAIAAAPDLPIVRVDGPTLPFPDGSFGVVLSFDVFEHIPDTDAHLREVARVLAPGGHYLLQTPNKWTNAVFETIRWRSPTAWQVDHCSLHTFGQLRRRLDRHGFDVRFYDVAVVTDFFRRKMRHYLGPAGSLLLAVVNPDRLPLRLRTNFYVEAKKRR